MVSFTPFIEPEILNIMINYCGKLETEFENILACLYKNKVKNLGTNYLYELDLKMLWANSLYLKGQSNEIFDLQFFSALINGLKYFRFWLGFRPSYSKFYESPLGMILCRVNLPGVK